MSKEFAKDIKVSPETVGLKPNQQTEVTVENGGKLQLTYKLKTTRPASVKPTKAFGVVKGAAKDTFKVNYKPTPDEKALTDSDRITMLFAVLPDGFQKQEDKRKEKREGASPAPKERTKKSPKTTGEQKQKVMKEKKPGRDPATAKCHEEPATAAKKAMPLQPSEPTKPSTGEVETSEPTKPETGTGEKQPLDPPTHKWMFISLKRIKKDKVTGTRK